MISIITPCYNSEKTIENTILSVVNQSFKDFEYIIVDGKSSDNTIKIIKKYAEMYDNIKYISEKDDSMTQALNKGFNMAKGEIVCSINADDTYEKDTLQIVADSFKKNSFDVLIGNTNFVKNGEVISKTRPKFMCNKYLLNLLDCSAPECSVFFKMDVVRKENFFNESCRYTQDYELYLRLIAKGYNFKYVDRYLSNFFISDDQYSTSLYDEMIKEACSYNSFPILFKFLKKTKINNIIKYALGWAER